jgi:hypothetical protein
MEQILPRAEQKALEHQVLSQDHATALEAFCAATEAREKRTDEAFVVHVTCMDERDTFASEAAGEPLGAAELYASAGGKVTPEKLLELYGAQMTEARDAGKEIVIHLMPHKCKHIHSGCAAFKTDEAAQKAYFSELVTSLKSRPEFADAKVIAEFYETDDHGVEPIAGDAPLESSRLMIANLQAKGRADESKAGEWDEAHAGNRIYVGDRPRAWTTRRNRAYHLHSGMDRQELIDGIALAIKVIKSHSHVQTDRVPIVIQNDRHVGGVAALPDDVNELIGLLNASPNLSEEALKVKVDELELISTETNPESWKGNEIEQTEVKQAA